MGGKPTKVGPSVADIIAGLYTAIGILAAVNYRNLTGKGQKVDVAMLDSQVSILENAIARYTATGVNPEPLGNRHPSIVPFEDFETANGSIMIAAGNDALFKKLVDALGVPDLADDERFKTNPKRGENYTAIRPLLAEPFLTKTTEEWIDILNQAGVPNGPINNIEGVVNDPQVIARNMVVEVDHPKAGKIKLPGVPIKMSESQGEVRTAAPMLGQHTDEILKEFGLSEEELNILKNSGGL